MMARLGLEVGARVIRGVRRPHNTVVEIAYERERIEDAVRALEQHAVGVRRIALAIGLPLLVTKRVKLPALSAAERRNILMLEPERFFADRSHGFVPAVSADSDLVFAAPDDLLAEWITALERIAPVDLVEPAPLALARALERAGIRDGRVVCDGGFFELAEGVVQNARHVYGASPDATITVPAIGGVPAPFAIAYGVALADDEQPDFATTLVAPEHASAIRGRRRRALSLAGATAALALVFALTSLDAWRERAVARVESGLVDLRQRAAPALALETELETRAQRSREIRELEAERPTRLSVLLALSHQLPPGAFVRGIRGSGSEWQLDGYAPSAASVVASLGAAPQFKGVHFLSAMDHAQVGHQSYESFALAFRFAPAP
jgi:hypothetical protein